MTLADLGLALLVVDNLGGDQLGSGRRLHSRAQTLRLCYNHLSDGPRCCDDGRLRSRYSLQCFLPLRNAHKHTF